jgi:uncharacterized membrane protein
VIRLSTVLYGSLTRKRIEAPPGLSATESPPGLGTYVDAMAALVPAEVLAAHAAIMAVATDTRSDGGDTSQVVITSSSALVVAFWGLLVTSIALYFVGRQAIPNGLDWLRAAIPPFAFTAWMLLQKPTAIDVVFGDLDDDALRYTIAVLLAVALTGLATWLARRADQASGGVPAIHVSPDPEQDGHPGRP